MGTVLVLLAMFAFVLALVALVMGRIKWARIPNRKVAAGVLAGSVVAFTAGGAMMPPPESVPATPTVPTVTATVTVTPTPTPTPTASDTPTPTPTPEPTPEPTTQEPVAPATQQANPPTIQPLVPQPAPSSKAAPAKTTQAPEPAKTTKKKVGTYANCAAAWADGAAPLYKGEPGYSAKLDGDKDGIACEKPPR